MANHSGTYVPSVTADSHSDQNVRVKQTSYTQVASTMFSSVVRAGSGTGSPTNHDWSNLKFNQPTGIEGGSEARVKKGIERPVYGQQYPRGYYNK